VAETFLERAGGPGRPRRALALLVQTLLASGCYAYTAVPPAAAPPPGSSIRLFVAPQVQLRAGETPLPADRRVIRGTLLPGSTADTLLFSVLLSNGDPRVPTRRLRGTVSVPVAGVERLEVRRLEKGRTAIVVATSALIGLGVLEWAFNITNPDKEGGGDPGGVNNARIVFLRLRR
jgi:hypothetical protein